VGRGIDQAIVATNANLLDAFFPYDRSELTRDAIDALRNDADILRSLLAEFPQVRIIVEGHCDERGSAEYNLGLGDHRARRAAELLARFGVPAERMQTVSYGKESPQCTEPAESCWSRNRRAHLSVRADPSFTGSLN
jgi:peptidoglycan-associated lipoprotein